MLIRIHKILFCVVFSPNFKMFSLHISLRTNYFLIILQQK